MATGDGRFAYVTNTGSGTVSRYAVARDGTLTLNDATAATPGGAPIDVDFSTGSRFLYVLNSTRHSLAGYQVNPHDGALSPVAVIAGLPASAAC